MAPTRQYASLVLPTNASKLTKLRRLFPRTIAVLDRRVCSHCPFDVKVIAIWIASLGPMAVCRSDHRCRPPVAFPNDVWVCCPIVLNSAFCSSFNDA